MDSVKKTGTKSRLLIAACVFQLRPVTQFKGTTLEILSDYWTDLYNELYYHGKLKTMVGIDNGCPLKPGGDVK